MAPPASTDDPYPTNSAPIVKNPVPLGGYVTRQVAGQKRIDDNDDVLNFKYPRLSENTTHPPPLRLLWNDEPQTDSGSQMPSPNVRITQAELASRAVKAIPKTFKRGSHGEGAIPTVSNPVPKQLVESSDDVPSPKGTHLQSREDLSVTNTQQMEEPQLQSEQHRMLLQGLLYSQRPPLLQGHPQLQQPMHGSSQPSSAPYQQAEQELPPHRINQQQPQPSSSPSPYAHHPPVPVVSSPYVFQQPQPPPAPVVPLPYIHQQPQPPPPAVVPLPYPPQQQARPQMYPPELHQLSPPVHAQQQPRAFQPPPPRPDVPQYQPHHHHPQSQLNPQVTYELHGSQHRSRRQDHNPMQPSGIHPIPPAGVEGPRAVPRQVQGEGFTAYEALLIQLIQNVYFEATGRTMTQREAVESWHQLDDQKKFAFHNHVCNTLAQVDGHRPPAGSTSQPANVAVNAPSATRPVTSDEYLVTHQGSELGFGLEEMEENHVVPVSNMMDLDEEVAAQGSNSGDRPAQLGEEDVAMRNAGKSRDVDGGEDEEDEDENVNVNENEDEDENEEYPSGVDGFGLPVNDMLEDHGPSDKQEMNARDAIAHRDAGLRTDRASDPLLLVLLGKFGTLVDAINRQTDAIQSMDSMLRNYVEDSKKVLAEVADAGKTAGGGSMANNDAPQNVVPPGIARKIQDRVAQITGQAVEPSSGDADKTSLKLLKERLRSHLLTLLGVPSLDLLATRCRPFTEAEIEGYLADDGSVECSPHNFRIDFQREWKRFSYNKEAREVFIENFLDVMMGSGMKEDQSIPEHLLRHDIVGQMLDSYVTGTLRKKYKELLQLAPECRDGEGDEEAKQRVQAAQKRHEAALRKAARVSRKTTTFVARNVVIAVTPSLQRHSVLFARLTAPNMSEDESDGPRKAVPRKFRIILAEWQSVKLRELLWELDREYRANWDKTPKAKRRPGNTPRDRKLKPDSRSEPGVAPQGLWRNCYNPEWVSKLSRYDRNSLRMIDSDYDFPNITRNAPPQPTAGSSREVTST